MPKIKTITVQIGNSDNKLTQEEWVYYIEQVDREMHLHAWEIHFFGFSNPQSKYQNACWVMNVHEDVLFSLKQELRSIGHTFRQDSIAWTEGVTEFLS